MTLRARIAASNRMMDARFLADASYRIPLADLSRLSAVRLDPALSGRSVLVATMSQIATVLALVALDGAARRIVLCPPEIDPVHLSTIVDIATIETVLVDERTPPAFGALSRPVVLCRPDALVPQAAAGSACATEWVLFTSGTTSRPKLVVHDLASLAAALSAATALEQGDVWSTFYDIRRYGGMQMLLRALLGGGSMVLSDADEPLGAFLGRAARDGVTHLNGTPSHWRRVLMGGDPGRFRPCCVRLSGEVADQPVLDRLRAAFPEAGIAHAYASTEAGVAFSVADGRAGFPAEWLDRTGPVALRLQDGSLRIRSAGVARGYLGSDMPALRDADGFVDTGDLLERDSDRLCFVGRREGVINVGGAKVHPEEVEAVINCHPQVAMSRARARPNPITGAVVVADVVLHEGAEPTDTKSQILAACRAILARHKVPVAVEVVPSLDVLATGKLARHV